MFLSEIADTVEYIELITPRDIVITNIRTVVDVDDFLIFPAQHQAYLFHKNGQFITKIGSMGQGPGEYVVLSDLEFDFKKKEIIISDLSKLLFYDMGGKFLRSRKMETFRMGISDSILWMGDVIRSIDRHKYLAFANSLYENGDSIACIPNSHYGKVTTYGPTTYTTSPYTKFFYYKNDSLHFKGDVSNDTIWKISGVNAMPYAYIDMGKYKLPLKYQPWVSEAEYERNKHNGYWIVPSLVEDDNFFYLTSYNLYIIPGTRKFIEMKYAVYDKKREKAFSTKDQYGFGITDDILGGPPFFPRWISNDYYINTIEGHELLEQVKAGDYTPSPSLKELLSRIDEDTNQLLILCRRKK